MLARTLVQRLRVLMDKRLWCDIVFVLHGVGCVHFITDLLIEYLDWAWPPPRATSTLLSSCY